MGSVLFRLVGKSAPSRRAASSPTGSRSGGQQPPEQAGDAPLYRTLSTHYHIPLYTASDPRIFSPARLRKPLATFPLRPSDAPIAIMMISSALSATRSVVSCGAHSRLPRGRARAGRATSGRRTQRSAPKPTHRMYPSSIPLISPQARRRRAAAHHGAPAPRHGPATRPLPGGAAAHRRRRAGGRVCRPVRPLQDV
jgi:hypothetical protein